MIRDKKSLIWLFKNSKTQIIPCLLLVFANIFLSGCVVFFAIASRGVIDAAAKGDKQEVLLKSIWFLGIILIWVFLRISKQIIEVSVQGKLEVSYRTRLFEHILNKEFIQVYKFHRGELLNRLTSDVNVVSEGVSYILSNFFGFISRLLFAIGVLIFIDPIFASIFALCGLILFITSKFFRNKMKSYHKQVQKMDGNARSFIQEVLDGLLVIRSFCIETFVVKRAEKLQVDHYIAKQQKNNFSILANTGFSVIFTLGYLFALVWSSYGIIEKTVTFGTLTAILQLIGQVQNPLSGLSGLAPKAYSVLASVERIVEIENLEADYELNSSNIIINELYKDMVSISFAGVTFGYTDEPVLKDIDVKFEKGIFTAISGSSGIGKSTLFKLMLGIYTPWKGSIHIELKSGQKLPIGKHIRKLFAYVPQNNFIFSGTIRENIMFFQSEVSEKEILEATRISCASEFIEKLPEGLDSFIGENGIGLSEGQIQRLAISRALVSNSPVLLLDESTSSLDFTTENNLLKNLSELKDKTCIIISHRSEVDNVCRQWIKVEECNLKTILIRRNC